MPVFGLILLCFAAGMAVIYACRFLYSLQEFTGFLKELSRGNLDTRLFPGSRGIFDTLAHDLAVTMEKTKERLNFAEAERQRMEAILRGMSDGVMITDTRGVVLLANQAFKRLLAVDNDIEGRQIAEVLRNAAIMEIFRETVSADDMVSEQIGIVRKGKDMHLIATAVPIHAEGAISGTVFTLHDITRLRQLEEMRKDFVANVSHEIKTPITAIKGFAETLLDGAMEDRENAARFLTMIQKHSERLNGLVDDLLTLSRIELGDVKISKAEVDLGDVVDTVFMTLRDKAGKRGLPLIKALPADTPHIMADRDRLIQILLNLVDNAIKFTEQGGITVGLDETGGRAVLYVQDTGMGIPQKNLHRLGERFYRVDRARSRELGGTGLGLAIVKHLVQAHDWKLRIESEQERGTRVIIVVDSYL
jgi:two-component system phosphate regulon sensor histidine kinase PhoR